MNINKTTVMLLLGLVFCANSIAQTQIQLSSESFQIDNRNFYISEVVDGRKNKTNIGYTRNWSDKKTDITLEPNMVTAIQNFANLSLPHDLNLTPIILKILYLNVKEERISISKKTARAEIKLEFYKEDALGVKKLFEIEHYEDHNFGDFSAEEISDIYEKRIRSVLRHCFNEFSQKEWQNEKSNTYVNRQTLTNPSEFEKLSITERDPLLKWINIISYKRMNSKHTEGWGVSYIGFSENKKLILPFIYSFDRYRIKPESLKNSNYRSANYFTPSFGTEFYYKLFPRVYTNISFQIPVGIERLRDNNGKKSNNFIIGIASSQGLLFIPKSDFGLVLGAGIYQKAHTSKIFKTNFGIELTGGIKF
ncbi:MAG: hypothetical protein L3J20_09490 [Flavobacteriaceae bacterium]|nr:hypothetical protein [Flavobacteriaceae bacterium]